MHRPRWAARAWATLPRQRILRLLSRHPTRLRSSLILSICCYLFGSFYRPSHGRYRPKRFQFFACVPGLRTRSAFSSLSSFKRFGISVSQLVRFQKCLDPNVNSGPCLLSFDLVICSLQSGRSCMEPTVGRVVIQWTNSGPGDGQVRNFA